MVVVIPMKSKWALLHVSLDWGRKVGGCSLTLLLTQPQTSHICLFQQFSCLLFANTTTSKSSVGVHKLYKTFPFTFLLIKLIPIVYSLY